MKQLCVMLLLVSSLAVGTPKVARTTKPEAPPLLNPDIVLSVWNLKVGDLLGKPKEIVIERFGAPSESEEPKMGARGLPDEGQLDYYSLPATSSRETTFFVGIDGRITAIKVFAKMDDDMDVRELVKHASLFEFDSGNFSNSMMQFFSATNKESRYTFQWRVGDTIHFHSVTFRR